MFVNNYSKEAKMNFYADNAQPPTTTLVKMNKSLSTQLS